MGVPAHQETAAEGEMPRSLTAFPSSSAFPSYSSPQKERIVDTVDMEDTFLSPTPVKTKEPSRIKIKDELAELPEKYGRLLEFFCSMTSSLRLLCLRKRTPTFQNVSCQVEILTGRRFLFIHLAQIKYILPEAIQIDKILIHDEKTKCMKSNLKIELLLDVVKDHHEESVFLALRNVFSSRLREFYSAHPEAPDVPEAELPDPSNERSIAIKANSISMDLPTLCETEIVNLTHLPASFRRHFSEKAVTVETEKTDPLSPIQTACITKEQIERLKTLPGSSSTACKTESTPMKLSARSSSVVVETPIQNTPMRPISPSRSVLTCEDEEKKTANQKCKQPATTAKKSLDFHRIEGEDTMASHKQISVCLSDLVLSIHQIFQAVNFRPITKEELIQKIIMNNLEIDDQREVEAQMEHVEKLVPDWFCKKLEPSGDVLYNVNKVSDVNSICERVNVI